MLYYTSSEIRGVVVINKLTVVSTIVYLFSLVVFLKTQ